jgi:hypothetical protein
MLWYGFGTYQNEPQMKKTRDCRFPRSTSTMYGVMKAMMKLRSQLVAVVWRCVSFELSCAVLLVGIRARSPYHGKTLRADLQREQLSRNDPSDRAP